MFTHMMYMNSDSVEVACSDAPVLKKKYFFRPSCARVMGMSAIMVMTSIL
jgi:hypothetical protein